MEDGPSGLRTGLAPGVCMSRRPELHVQTWSSEERAWPDDPIARGPLRISGTVIGDEASWYVATDRLGWSTLALISTPDRLEGWDAAGTIERCAEGVCEPVQTALALQDSLRACASPDRIRRVGLAVARVGPHGRLVELLNVSLPTVLHWDPVEGISPYEPLFTDLDSMNLGACSEMLRLRAGAALVLTTEGVLPDEAGWAELRGFTRALALDPLGGTLADAPPSELRRMLSSSWNLRQGPVGMVVAGLPSILEEVA